MALRPPKYFKQYDAQMCCGRIVYLEAREQPLRLSMPACEMHWLAENLQTRSHMVLLSRAAHITPEVVEHYHLFVRLCVLAASDVVEIQHGSNPCWFCVRFVLVRAIQVHDLCLTYGSKQLESSTE